MYTNSRALAKQPTSNLHNEKTCEAPVRVHIDFPFEIKFQAQLNCIESMLREIPQEDEAVLKDRHQVRWLLIYSNYSTNSSLEDVRQHTTLKNISEICRIF